MSHGVHAVQHEVEHEIKHEDGHHGGHDPIGTTLSQNKKIALLIAVIALCLAFSETLGKSAQTNALKYNIEAANLWNFFQAKSIRRTNTLVAAEAAKIELATADPARKEALQKQIADWERTAARYRSEPEAANGKGEGTIELMGRAIAEGKKHDDAMAKYHHYEVASAAFQIAIVLASATVITGMMVLTYASMGLALFGLAFMAIGLFAPHAVHLF